MMECLVSRYDNDDNYYDDNDDNDGLSRLQVLGPGLPPHYRHQLRGPVPQAHQDRGQERLLGDQKGRLD